jgi:Protein of unknown function (DUF4232)
MDLRSRVSRRAGVSAAVAGLAVLLPAVALAATASGPVHAAPACTTEHTQVWLGLPGDGTAGATFYQLEFSNIGPATCTLTGFPGVSAVRRSGHPVGLPASRTGHDSVVTLAPGGTGHAVLKVTDAGAVCAHPVTAAGLKVHPPGQTRPQPAQLAVEACPNRRTMQVRAVHADTGIPGFTIR